MSTANSPRRVLDAGLALDQTLALQPVDEPGQTAARQQHRVGELGHAQPVLRGLDELDQDVVGRERELVLVHQVRFQPRSTSACERRNSRHAVRPSPEGLAGARRPGAR